jgi:DNA-binding beta-propeller fold protein YncE
MRILLYISFLLLAYSCIKPKKISNEQAIEPLDEKIIIVNEGGFGKGNAEISYIDPLNGTINNELFKKANNNGILGDVFQSICFKNNVAYCVLNNSGIIKKINLTDFKLIGEISGLVQPRYMSFINENTAIVSSLDLNMNSVYNPLSIINTELNSKTATIGMQGWTEGLLALGNCTFICNYYKGILYKLNNKTLQITDSVYLGYGCSEVINYKNGQLLVLCSGDYSNANVKSKIHVIDTSNFDLKKTMEMSTSGYSNISYLDADNELLILGENAVKKIDIDNTVTSDFIIADSTATLYSFGYDKKYKKYYVCDAKDYQQKGQVIVYDKNGVRLAAISAGYIPSKIYFTY